MRGRKRPLMLCTGVGSAPGCQKAANGGAGAHPTALAHLQPARDGAAHLWRTALTS